MAYHQAPLPFVGQKRQFLNQYRTVLGELSEDGKGWTIIDAFGGSGLLSHTAKTSLPAARVIYNDFDRYSDRIAHIPDTNRLRQQLAAVLLSAPRAKKLSPLVKEQALETIKQFDGFVDYRAVSTWLLFSGQYANDFPELERKTLYNTIRRSDYRTPEGYLAGVEVVCQDFELLLNQYCDTDKVLLVLDPPYVCTMQGMYANDTYFGMIDFLRLMRLVKPPFIFFSSTRSELIDYLDHIIKHRLDNWHSFSYYHRLSVRAYISQSASYEDNLVYKLE